MTSKQIFDCLRLLDEEPLLDLTQATKCFPVKCSRATLERWIRQGVRGGIRLETIQIGNRRFTSELAIQRFLISQQNTEPEESRLPPKHGSMTKDEINTALRRHNLPNPLESQN